MRLSDFQALSFDCYGTLIDWETGIAATLGPWAKNHGCALSEDAILERYAEHEARIEAEHPREPYPQILARTMQALADDLVLPVHSTLLSVFAQSVAQWPAFPDSLAALDDLGRRYRLLVLSNIDRASFATSARRLDVTFDAVITAEDVGSYKPNPRNFTALTDQAAELGIEPGALLHVAQSLFHDHVPAKKAGLSTVWINRRHARPGWGATPPPQTAVEPDWEFDSMADFAAAVEADFA